MKVLSLAALCVAVTAGTASAAVVEDFQFNTIGDTEGWTALANIDGPGSGPAFIVADGDSLNGLANGGDPRLGRLALNATTTATWDAVIFRVRETTETDQVVNTFDPTGLVLVVNGTTGTFGGGTVLSDSSLFSATASGDGFFTVTADISSLGSTDIDQLRLDPIGAPDANNNLFEVDFIQVTDTTLVPEPGSIALLSLSGLLVAGRRRRR